MDTQLPKLLQKGDQESINLSKLLATLPLAVESTPETRQVGDYLLPFGVGMEFECDMGPDYNVRWFEEIPGMVEVNVDRSEQRYRIVKGLEGLQALYRLSQGLCKYSLLNFGSGIHYHIGLDDYYDDFVKVLENDKEQKLQEHILSELEKWNYKGSYNRRAVSTGMGWVRLQRGFRTAEIRIGEMTFNYELLFKRITHACKIFREVTLGLEEKLLLRNNPWLRYEKQDINEIIKNRVKKINPHVRNN